MDQPTSFDIRKILEFLPHRYPFLLVDRVNEIVDGEYIKAHKCVSFNEPFFQGHFPGVPVMPGVLIIEALAQAGGLLVLLLLPGNRENLCRTATPAVPDSTHPDYPAHGPYLPRESPERNFGRNLPQYAYFWIITHPRLNTLI
mgnify:CR=1 FL=1